MKMRIKVPYGVASSHRLGCLSDITTGQAVAPTFVAGDALITQDDGTGTDNADNIPTVVDTTNILWTISAAEATRPTSAGNKRLLQIYDQGTKVWIDLDVAIDFEEDGALDFGTAAAIANGTITLRSGHGLATVGSVLVTLLQGTDAKGKSRIATYSGTGDVFNVDPAWNASGEALPSGTIIYRADPAPPAPTSTVPAVNVTQINGGSYIEGATLTPLKAFRIMLAALAGKASGAGGATVTFRDTTDATDRIVAAVDDDGNRTAVTLDAS